jgi:predicted MFS family arabinose efflux permease
VLLFAASGAASSYHAIASPTFALWTPDEARGQVYGLAVTALKIAQGLGVAVAGLAAEHVPPHQVVASGGVLGVLAALGVGVLWRHSASRSSTPASRG